MSGKNRTKTRIAVYLVGTSREGLLLAKRENTGHMDGLWSLVAGHVDEGESCLDAMIREVQEECGVELIPAELNLVGAMHHLSEPFDYINFVYSVNLDGKELRNLEPHKCKTLQFHAIDNLPIEMAGYIRDIIHRTLKADNSSAWLCEFGWA